MMTAILITLAVITLIPGGWMLCGMAWVHRNIGYVEQESHAVRIAVLLAVVLVLLGAACSVAAVYINLGD